MDGRRFDDLARIFASRTDRRQLLRRGIGAVAAAGGLIQASPVDAARRGKPPTTAICNPDGAGGYTHITINTALLPGYLAAGAFVDAGCCSSVDCGAGSDSCEELFCNPATGACETTWLADGTECTPNGTINHCRLPYTCQSGVCSEGVGVICAEIFGCTRSLGCDPATGQCRTGPRPDGTRCFRSSGCVDGFCSDGVCVDPPVIECLSNACRPCSFDACTGSCVCYSVACLTTDCRSGHCDPEVGCVFTDINDGLPCQDGGLTGTCNAGACVIPI